MDATPTPTTAPAWFEFTHDTADQLNCNKCVVLVGDAALIHQVTHFVDEACCHTAVVEAFTRAADEGVSATRCCTPADMPHVTFTSGENQRTAQRCMAVFGCTPFLAILDMRDDDDEHCFVLELEGRVSTDMDTTAAAALREAVTQFLMRVGRGTEPRCRQGAAPPPCNVFRPVHGVVLCEARAAVTATFPRLLGKARASTASTPEFGSSSAATPACGSLCVFWSDRCPCCPSMLMLIEALVKLIRLVAAHHAGHPSDNVSFTFPFLVANIDENDFTQEEWPVAQREQVVPALVAYPASSSKPVLFTGERLPPRLAGFICEHCLPSGKLVACTPHITEQVCSVASQLSISELMTVLKEDSEGYKAASQAYEAFAGAEPTAEAVERLYTFFSNVRDAVLPFALEAEVRRMFAEGGAAASGSSSDALVEDEDGGEEVRAGNDLAEAKGGDRAGAAVASAPAAAAVDKSYKRPRA
ncbi:hypothetical protein ABL78_5294 [Leptomonas seymouri]|uniref:Uncharacterized protein n=1 Tax=Leptomonas seymouri TaxID=5684 RepID=A0A0N1I3N9_LEPSE|nr:hypothetical protein ABL78_5294 [Leptomonas seymouri]|eukprot:KPI85644.1 hypothetical protein ABL78_5294 [Leptomonas seymouri]